MSLGLTVVAGWCALDLAAVTTYVGLHRLSARRRAAAPPRRPTLFVVDADA